MSDGGAHIQVKPLDPLLHVLPHVVEIAEVDEALELVVFQQGAREIVVGSQHIVQAPRIPTSSSSDRAPPAADNSLAPASVTLMADCAGGEVQFDRRTGRPTEANCRLKCA